MFLYSAKASTTNYNLNVNYAFHDEILHSICLKLKMKCLETCFYNNLSYMLKGQLFIIA